MNPIEEERRLVARILGGDRDALFFFLGDFGAIAKSVFRRFDRFSSAEELFQGFCVRLWDNDWARLRQWKGAGSLRGFVRRAAWRHAIDVYRKERRLRELEVPIDEDESVEVEDSQRRVKALAGKLSAQEVRHEFDRLQSRLHAAMECLRAADREVLVLDYYEQLPGRDAAARLQITSTAYRKRLERANLRLSQIVWKDFPDLRDHLSGTFDS
jgi:RNA polymerase sigma factor (sigma-70 family)